MKVFSIVFIFFFYVTLYGSDYVVVTYNTSLIQTLSKKQIKDIYMMKRHFINCMKIIPVNLPTSLLIREKFEKNVLKVNREKLSNYWIRQHFQGIRPPLIQSSFVSVKLFLKNVDGAIGYLPKKSMSSDLKVLYEF